METKRANTGLLVGGILLIVFGVLALINQYFHFADWGTLWPLTVVIFGSLFYVAMFAGGRDAAGFAVPATIISGIGLILLYQSITGRWETWAYCWALIVVFVGLGIYIMGWYADDRAHKKSGVDVMRVGLILFVVFGMIFEMIFSSFNNMLFPILLILLGVYLIFSRSRNDEQPTDDSAGTVPPTS
jgi:peptidoglycan/LPS O-acetylase OafA/YrhL